MRILNKSEISNNFSRAAASYESRARLQLTVAKELISQCKDFTGLTLDLGSGPGIIAKNSQLNLVPLDLSFEMCKLAGTRAVNADFENLPFKDASFDNVISSLSLQWAEDFEKTLKEIFRVLKPGGRFGFSTLSNNSLKDLRDAFAYLDGEEHIMEFHHLLKIYAVLKRCGFEDLAVSMQKITYQYDDILAALKSIKSIGASYNFTAGRTGLRGKGYFKKLEPVYKNICKADGKIPLRWEVFYVTGRKI